jgi:hypothetical protein
MGYTARQAMGGIADDAVATLKRASGLVDPYFPEAICHVDQIIALRKNRKFTQAMLGKKPTVAVPTCYETAPGIPGGIGVEQALRPLRAAVYVHEHATLVALSAVAMVAIPFFLGVAVGKRVK